MIRNIRLDIEYDGTAYCGWQRQENGRSIQQVLEEAIAVITKSPVALHGSGRTDAGVHALNQTANFQTTVTAHMVAFHRGLNSILPRDIVIKRATEVGPEFHARYSAKSKTYRYVVLNRDTPAALERHCCWFIPQPLALADMRACLPQITGRRDFASFRSAGSSNINPVRTVFQAELDVVDGGRIIFTFTADGFLRHMIRNLVGTIVAVGRKKLTAEDFPAIFAGCDRALAGPRAPAQGLFLVEVHY
ncbi:MAG: tRNA pseudouridine(38-40) synthase TruA [Deltaproteobacteria bacterium]|nr:tRNA pseudouridine(38-40) synthase TruA [Deltaproteobacteria bacterium]